MATVSDKELALAGVYADSMLELGVARDEADSLLDELLELSGLLTKNVEFDAFLASPSVDPDVRRETIEKVFRTRASDLLVNSLQILNRKGRLQILHSVIEAYRLAHNELRGRIDVRVQTAVPLDDDHRDSLKRIIKERTGREGILVETVDDRIIGGLIVHIGDEKLDVSISRQLDRLGVALNERASQEIHSSDRAYWSETV